MTHLDKATSYIGISKLISNERMLELVRSGTELRGRCTGKTFGACLEYIAKVMQEPELEGVFINGRTIDDSKRIAFMTMDIVRKLELDYFELRKVHGRLQLRYNVLRGQFSQAEQKEIDHESERI